MIQTENDLMIQGGILMTKYGIAIFPAKTIQDDVNALRKRYDPHYALIPPHITLKSAFTIDEQKRDHIIATLSDIAKQTNPFTIHIQKVSTFAPLTNTIYYKVEPNPTLTTLNRQMNSGTFSNNNKFSFVPHITIAQKLSDEEYSDVYGTLQLKKAQFTDEIDRFQLCYQLDNGVWTVYETFIFGQK